MQLGKCTECMLIYSIWPEFNDQLKKGAVIKRWASEKCHPKDNIFYFTSKLNESD